MVLAADLMTRWPAVAVGVEVNFRGICEDQVTGIGDRDLLANGQILITHEHTALTGNCHRAGIGDRTR